MSEVQGRQENLVINYRKLKARKAYLELSNMDLIQRAGMGSRTVSAFLNGAKTLNLQTIERLAAELGLRVIVDFQPIEQKTD